MIQGGVQTTTGVCPSAGIYYIPNRSYIRKPTNQVAAYTRGGFCFCDESLQRAAGEGAGTSPVLPDLRTKIPVTRLPGSDDGVGCVGRASTWLPPDLGIEV